MDGSQSLGGLLFRSWKRMLKATLGSLILFGYFSLPVVLAVILLAPDVLGFVVIALGTQIMLTGAYSLVMGDERVGEFKGKLEGVPLRELLTISLIIGGGAQFLLLGVPALVGLYTNPTAAFFIAALFPFVDGKLNEYSRWLSPSAIVRYGIFKGLELSAAFSGLDLDTIESGFPDFYAGRYS